MARGDVAFHADITEAEAADVLWVVTSLATFTQLYQERGLTVEETADRLIAIVTRSICRE